MHKLTEFGTCEVDLTETPVGRRGELTAGPDGLDPDVPDEREELQERGFPVPEKGGPEKPDMGHLFGAPPAIDEPFPF